MLISKRQNN